MLLVNLSTTYLHQSTSTITWSRSLLALEYKITKDFRQEAFNHLRSLHILRTRLAYDYIDYLFFNQCCGSAFIVCGSGSSKFGQCGSGSLTIKIKSPNFSKNIYS